MDQDFLTRLLQKRQPIMLAPDDSDDQSTLADQLMNGSQAPTPEESIAQSVAKRSIAPNPGDIVGDTSKYQLFPPEVYNNALENARSATANREEELKQHALESILAQRRAMQDQGVAEDSLPKLPNNEEEVKRLQDKMQEAKWGTLDPNADRGMAMSLADRHGDSDPNIQRTLAANPENPAPEDSKNVESNKEIPIEQQGVDSRMSDLLDAQKQSSMLAAMQMMGKGAERIGAGFAHREADKNYLNEMTPMINQPVENVMNQRKLAMQSLEEDTKGRDLKLKKNMDNPNSDESKMARDIVDTAGLNIKTEGMSATQLSQHLPAIKTILETNLNREMKMQLSEERMKAAAEKVNDKKDQHIKDKQSANDMQINRQLSTARSMPAVMQAEKDIYAAAKANELFHQYPDANKMPMPQAKMLTIEIAKIAQGGIPTKTELDALSPNALNGILSTAWGRLKNSPSPANAGAFLKEYKNYADGITKQAEKILEENYTRILETAKPHMSQDGYKLAQEQYVNRFKNNQKHLNIPQGAVTIKRKSDGATKTLSSQDATDFLKDPGYELVK
jgi:hypothetical protein